MVKGGDISLATAPQEVVAILQTTASNDRSIADYRGSFGDPLLELVFQSNKELPREVGVLPRLQQGEVRALQ